MQLKCLIKQITLILCIISIALYVNSIMYNIVEEYDVSNMLVGNGRWRFFTNFFVFVFFVYSIKYINNKVDKIGRYFMYFFLYAFIVSILINSSLSYSAYLPPLFLPVLSYAFGYRYGTGVINEKHIVCLFLLLFLLVTFFYISTARTLLFIYGFDVNINISYIPLICSPVLFFIKNKYLKIVLLTILLLLLLSSGKRGGLVAFTFGYLSVFSLRSGNVRTTFFKYLLMFLVLWGVYEYFSAELMENRTIGRFFDNDGDMTSGRNSIYEEVWTKFFNSSILGILFGHGFFSVNKYLSEGMSAHNDYLEVLFDYGLIGIIMYLFLHGTLLFKLKELYQSKSNVLEPFVYSYVVFLVLSFVSHMVGYSYFFLQTMWFGIILGYSRYNKINK